MQENEKQGKCLKCLNDELVMDGIHKKYCSKIAKRNDHSGLR